MCGICGVYSRTYGLSETKIFKQLLWLNALRGEDSTGVARVQRKGPVDISKSLAPSPFWLAKNGEYIDPKGVDPIAYLGHCRYATQGEVNINNAHPFRFKNVVGMHNGTIKKKFKGRDKYGTDSEAVFALLDENDGDIRPVIEEINDSDSAYALVWVDLNKHTLNFIKNSKRTLAFTYLYSQTTLVWSSESAMIDFALERNNLSYNQGWGGDVKDRYFTLSTHDHLVVPLDKSPKEAFINKLDIPEAKTKVYATNYGDWDNWYQNPETGVWESSLTKGYESVGKDYSKSGGTTYRSQGSNTGGASSAPGKQEPGPSSQTGGKQQGQSISLTELRNRWEALQAKPESKQLTIEHQSLASIESYGGYRQKHGDRLAKLAWLDGGSAPAENTSNAIRVQTGGIDDETVTQYLGHGGAWLSAHEFKHKMDNGCFCCGTVVNPDDFAEVVNVRWHDRDNWACGDCYETSEADWVKLTIDGTIPLTTTKGA